MEDHHPKMMDLAFQVTDIGGRHALQELILQAAMAAVLLGVDEEAFADRSLETWEIASGILGEICEKLETETGRADLARQGLTRGGAQAQDQDLE